jgi:hypothetical protein
MPALTRRNVDFARENARQRDNRTYGYGGSWHPTNLARTTDCSGIVTHTLDGAINGVRMTWQRHGLSTEAYRYLKVGAVGPFGTINVGSNRADVPRGSVLVIGLQHGPGGGRNSHMACDLEGVAIESSGGNGQQYGGPARHWNHPLFHQFFYLPSAVDGAPLPYSPPRPPGVDFIDFGDTGDRVRIVQERLNRDYPAYSKLVVDGEFGPATLYVVKEFQRRAGLVVDGIVGPATLTTLGLSATL